MKQQAPDILFVINNFSFLKSHRLGQIKFLSERGLKISICTDCKNVKGQEIEGLRNTGIEVIHLNLSRSSIGIFRNMKSLIKLLFVILKIKPKKLSLISAKPIVIGGLISLFYRFEKVYFSITGLGYAFIDPSIKARFIKNIITNIYRIIFLKKRVAVIFQNHDDLNLFLKRRIVTLDKCVVISGNGIDTSLFNSKREKSQKIRFLFASRLLKDKGIREFVEAVDRLGSKEATFTIVGDLDLENPNCISEEYFHRIKENPDISYIGKVEHSQMPDLFNSSDIFVLPSYREGLPQVALEAASCKMPLILSDVEGCRECITNKKNGYLVKKGNSEHLEKKMRFFIDNPEVSEKMGEESRKYINERFSKEKIYNSLYQLYSN
tara:strand:+ start:1343 stop:2479 length:1137 start_codon:yes stop_codon:yes gene_type:complete